MNLRIRNRHTFACCALTSVLLVSIITWTSYQHNVSSLLPLVKRSRHTPVNRQTRIATSTTVQLLNPIRFANETDFNCVIAKFEQLGFPVCTYKAEYDTFISKAFLQGDYFERGYVIRTVNFMKSHHDVTFLDLGANLGSYALPVAHVGRHVVAVEATWNTVRRLSKSVHLGKISANIDLVPYAIAGKRYVTFMKINPVQPGVNKMSDVSCEKDCVNVSVITLNDILPLMRNKKAMMKIDVEGAEINVFTPSSAGDFFREIDVLIIQMEWGFYVNEYSHTLEKRRLVDEFLNFFYEKHYVMYDADTELMLDSHWTKWPGNICLRKGNKSGRLFDI